MSTLSNVVRVHLDRDQRLFFGSFVFQCYFLPDNVHMSKINAKIVNTKRSASLERGLKPFTDSDKPPMLKTVISLS